MRHYFSRLLKNQSGQNVIEYTVVLTLVILSVIIMGPYVIRSWNANMKGWEDSVIDSFNDPLIDPGNVIKLPGCDCEWIPCDVDEPQQCCGLLNAGCDWFQMSQTYVCTGLGCPKDLPPPPEGCNPDPACCQTCDENLPNPGGQTKEQCGSCGVEASNAQLRCPVDDPTCPITSICNPDTHACEPSCPDGYREGWNLCGDPAAPKDYFCYRDTTCDFSCSGPVPDGFRYAGLCPNDDVGLSEADVDPVTHSLAYAMVPIGGCTDDRKCEVQCNDPLIPGSCASGICRSCVCPLEELATPTYSPVDGPDCAPGYTEQDGYCAMGHYYTGAPTDSNLSILCQKRPEPIDPGTASSCPGPVYGDHYSYADGINADETLRCHAIIGPTFAACAEVATPTDFNSFYQTNCNCGPNFAVLVSQTTSGRNLGNSCTANAQTGSCTARTKMGGNESNPRPIPGKCCVCLPISYPDIGNRGYYLNL